MTWLIISILTISVLITMIIYIYNKLKKLKEITNDAFETVDKNLIIRFELVPDLLNSVKDTMKYEDEIISEISNAKEKYVNAICIEDKARTAKSFATNLNSLYTLAEAYPELSSCSDFWKIQQELDSTKNEYENSIKIYNDAVQAYNNAIISFPKTTIAHLFKFEKASFFE